MVRFKRGFTLIELMIVVVIIGIIAAIAYPSYMDSVRKSNRAEGKAEMVDLAQRLQRCYTTYGSFNDVANRCTVYEDLTDGTAVKSRGRGFYEIRIGVPVVGDPAATTYRLTATADIAPQTEDTGCTVLTLDHTGEKGPADCW